MSEEFRLDQVDEGSLYEIVSMDDEAVSRETGACVGMSVVVLKKALKSIVQFGYSQMELEADLLHLIRVQPV